MASDRRKYEKAVDKWTSLHINGAFSVPEAEGVVAVLTSNYPYNLIRHSEDGDFDATKAIEDDTYDWTEFNQEAIEVTEKLGTVGVISELAINVSIRDTIKLIQDPNVTDMIIIGHGSLAGVFLRGATNDFFDWQQASEHSTHLKLGSIVQRQCGILPRSLNPPLRMFLVDDMVNVRAARGKIFAPKGIECPDNELISPVFDSNMPPSYQWLRSNFVNKK